MPRESLPAEATARDRDVLLLNTEKKVYGFDLGETAKVSIGRHDSNDLQFNTRNVSNYHAEILNEPEGLLLHDLGSTNGTFVNEERVRRRQIVHGDRIRIGSYEILVRMSSANGDSGDELQPGVVEESGEFRREAAGHGAVTLKQLLASFCRESRSLKLVLSGGPRQEVCVYFRDGKLIHAESGGARAEKALFRAFEWRGGRFRVEGFPEKESIPRQIGLPIEALVEDGEQQASEMSALLGELPPLEVPLRLRESCKLRICDFAPAELEVFQALVRGGTLAGALEALSMTDLRILRIAQALLRKKVFEVEESSSLLEHTNVLRRV